MAVYEFRCKSCATQFESMRPMSQMNAPAPCPTCKSEETMRLLSLFAAPAKSGDPGAEACESSREMGTPCCRMPGGGGCGSFGLN